MRLDVQGILFWGVNLGYGSLKNHVPEDVIEGMDESPEDSEIIAKVFGIDKATLLETLRKTQPDRSYVGDDDISKVAGIEAHRHGHCKDPSTFLAIVGTVTEANWADSVLVETKPPEAEWEDKVFLALNLLEIKAPENMGWHLTSYFW